MKIIVSPIGRIYNLSQDEASQAKLGDCDRLRASRMTTQTPRCIVCIPTSLIAFQESHLVVSANRMTSVAGET